MENREGKQILFNRITISMVVVGLAYIFAECILGKNNSYEYKIVMSIWLISYIIITNIIEPIVMKKFHDKSYNQIVNYLIYAGIDAVGLLGILLFVLGIANVKDLFHYVGAVLFVASMIIKPKYYDLFESDDEGQGQINRKEGAR